MLIKDYEKYLRDKKYPEASIKIYSRKIQNLLDKGWSEEDLIRGVFNIIPSFRKGGQHFDAKDHGNTAAALSHLLDMLIEPLIESFFIERTASFSTFTPKKRYVTSYKIANHRIFLTYSDTGTAIKKISKKRFIELIVMLHSNKFVLSPSNTASLVPTAFDYHSGYFNYSFDDRTEDHCLYLFDSEKSASRANAANTAYNTWIKYFIK